MRFSSVLASLTLALAASLTACGGGGDASSSSSGSGSGGGSGSASGGGTSTPTETVKYYRRTDNATALALDGENSYFCSWGDCPGGATCGVKITGTERGSAVDWMIPTTASGGNKVKTTFDILRNGSNVTLLYQGSRAGDYVPASSWADAARGDQGYCGGASSGSGSGGSGGSGSSGGSSGSGSGTGASTGQIAVYTRNSSLPSGIVVTIDGATAGTLTQYFRSTPNCGDAGTVTRTLNAGTHTVSARVNSTSWGPASVTITAGGCLTYELQ